MNAEIQHKRFADDNHGRIYNITTQLGSLYNHAWEYLLEDRRYIAL